MKNKKTVSRSNAELFEGIFGDKLKDPSAEVKDDNIFQMQRDQVPLGIRLSNGLFNYLTLIFTNILPLAILINIAVPFCDMNESVFSMFKSIFPKVISLIVLSACILFIIKAANVLVNSILIYFYAKITRKHMEIIAENKKKIIENLKKKDEEDKRKQDEEFAKEVKKAEELAAKEVEVRKSLKSISDKIFDYWMNSDESKNIREDYEGCVTEFQQDLFNIFVCVREKKVDVVELDNPYNANFVFAITNNRFISKGFTSWKYMQKYINEVSPSTKDELKALLRS